MQTYTTKLHDTVRQTAQGRVAIEVLEPRSPELAFQLKSLQDELRFLEDRLARIADDPLTDDREYLRSGQEVQAKRKMLEEFSRQALQRVTQRGWDNLILDSGLTQIASYSWARCMQFCVVGTGNTAPAVGQTALDGEVARTGTYLTGTGNCGTTRPATNQWQHKLTYDFALGALNGTYAEIGFSPLGSAGPNLFSRSLIQSSGVPTAVTVSSTQQLRVVYTLTVTLGPMSITRDVPNVAGWTVVTPSGAVTASQAGNTVTASANIFAAGDVDKAILWSGGQFAVITAFLSATQVTVDRAQNVTSKAFSLLSGTTGAVALQDLPANTLDTLNTNGNINSNGILEPSYSNFFPGFVSTSSTALATPGTGVDRQTGQSWYQATLVGLAYISGYTRDFRLSATVNDANFNIRSAGWGSAFNGNLVFLFDSNQPKSNLYTLELIWNLSWGRN